MDLKKAVRGDTTQDAERTSVRTRDGRILPEERGSEERLVAAELLEKSSDRSASRDDLDIEDDLDFVHARAVILPSATDELRSPNEVRSANPRVSYEKVAQEPEVERRSAIERSRPSEAPIDSTRSPEGSFFRTEEERATTLVLMESGAFWPGWVKEIQRRAPNSMVEVQSASESVEGFGGRVLRRLVSLRERGVRLRAAVYAASSPITEQERGVRRLLCSTLLDVLGDGGELVLSGEGWSTWGVDARSRAELMALAGDLSYELPRSSAPPPPARAGLPPAPSKVVRARSVTVSVRFGDAPDESGVHKAAQPVERGSLVRRTEGRDGAARAGDASEDDDELTREIA